LSIKQLPLAHHFETLDQQHDAASLGMWVFLATEILIFGAMFAGYSAYRSMYTEEFEEASAHLNILIGGINTVVLLTSSLTMALSVYAAHVGQQRLLVTCLVLTVALGTLFMVFKAIEYYDDYKENLVPNLAFDNAEWRHPGPVKLFLMFYYLMTGLHAVHLTAGIGLLIWLIGKAARGAFTPTYFTPVEVSGLYWHFVDIVWIFLLPLLYLIGTHSVRDLHF
jgi:cytochrome c oxidase subunit 3